MQRRCLNNVPKSRMAENHPTPPRSILQKVNAVLAWPFALLIKAYRVISPLKKYLLGSTAGMLRNDALIIAEAAALTPSPRADRGPARSGGDRKGCG